MIDRKEACDERGGVSCWGRRGRILRCAGTIVVVALGTWLGHAVWGRVRSGEAGDAMVIAHITDTHLSTAPSGATTTPWTHKIIVGGYKLHKKCLGRSVQLFEETVRLINEKVQPDLVVITGDIVDRAGDAAAWREAARIIREIEAPVLVAQGDHDAPAGPEAFRKYCGPLYCKTAIRGVPFFALPFKANEATLQRFEQDFSRASSRIGLKVLSIHRMLKASWLMRELSRAFYCPTLLSPHRAELLQILHRDTGQVLVLCGHSHTNTVSRDGNILHVCTSSLVEYPHEIRLVYLTGRRVRSRVVRLSSLRKQRSRRAGDGLRP
ncbi:MAG: hypothetical protein GXP31_10915 [Kiritimatiellaeota bacterium]|nr:hypothetical protein [Kiritimatiellota bacterium]